MARAARRPPPRDPGRQAADEPVGLSALTAREREVLERLATGARTRDIAAELGIAEPTVKRHLTTVYRKLGVGNRVQAVTRLLRDGAPPTGDAPVRQR